MNVRMCRTTACPAGHRATARPGPGPAVRRRPGRRRGPAGALTAQVRRVGAGAIRGGSIPGGWTAPGVAASPRRPVRAAAGGPRRGPAIRPAAGRETVPRHAGRPARPHPARPHPARPHPARSGPAWSGPARSGRSRNGPSRSGPAMARPALAGRPAGRAPRCPWATGKPRGDRARRVLAAGRRAGTGGRAGCTGLPQAARGAGRQWIARRTRLRGIARRTRLQRIARRTRLRGIAGTGWLGLAARGLGIGIIAAAAMIGAVATVVTGRQPGTLLGAAVLAGTVAAALIIQPRAGRMIFPAPVLCYLTAALAAGVSYDHSADRTALAIDAAQWIASGFFFMVLATVLAIAIVAARWLLQRHSGRGPAGPDWSRPGGRGSGRPDPATRTGLRDEQDTGRWGDPGARPPSGCRARRCGPARRGPTSAPNSAPGGARTSVPASPRCCGPDPTTSPAGRSAARGA